MKSLLDKNIQKQLTEYDQVMSGIRNAEEFYRAIVDLPFQNKLFTTSLDLGIIVFLRVNTSDGMIDRVALSNTELALEAVRASVKPFHEIRIPLKENKNIVAQSIRKNISIATDDWNYLFTPSLSAEQARMNQTSASIECSIVEPLTTNPAGALIFSFFQPERLLGKSHHAFLTEYARIVSRHLGRF